MKIQEPVQLFDICKNYHRGADTSVAANTSIAGVKGELRKQVYQLVKQSPCGITCEEIERALGMKHQTASARIAELRRDGFIVDTGRRQPTTSGRPARVYEVAT